jgi:hypothetical protein
MSLLPSNHAPFLSQNDPTKMQILSYHSSIKNSPGFPMPLMLSSNSLILHQILYHLAPPSTADLFWPIPTLPFIMQPYWIFPVLPHTILSSLFSIYSIVGSWLTYPVLWEDSPDLQTSLETQPIISHHTFSHSINHTFLWVIKAPWTRTQQEPPSRPVSSMHPLKQWANYVLPKVVNGLVS